MKERYDFEITDDQYRLAFKSILESKFSADSRYLSLIVEEIIIIWDDFVTELEEGYSMSAYEFYNDLDIIRKPVDLLMNSDLLNNYPEHQFTLKIIYLIDDRYRAISREYLAYSDSEPWWRRRILINASSDYFDSI